MRSFKLLLIVLITAGCGVVPTLIPSGNQPAIRPTDSPPATIAARPSESALPSPAAATPAPSDSGLATPNAAPVSADDAIRLVQQKYPEFKSIQRRPAGSIGASTNITVQDRPGGWNIIFWQGSGDCPAGCINNHFWYAAVEKTGSATIAGEFVREFDSASNAVKTRGAPMWGVPPP